MIQGSRNGLVIKLLRNGKLDHQGDKDSYDRSDQDQGTIGSFIFTNNAVIEQAYNKGSSKSRKLHILIVELPELEMVGKLIIHFGWIAGTQLIYQGTDALSRGEVSRSSMTVQKFLQSLTLNQTAFDLQNSF